MPPITPSLPTRPWRVTRRPGRPHLVVCGANQLAYRLVEELVTGHREDVTVVVPSRTTNKAPDIAALPRVRIVVAERLDGKAFQDAKLGQARSLALVADDDVGNLHAALRAHEFNRDLRLVIRMSNRNLRDRLHELFPDCTALSDAATAAPAFVAAARGRSQTVRLPGKTMVVATRKEVAAGQIVCTLASDIDQPGGPRLLPDSDKPDDVVLVAKDGQREPVHDDWEDPRDDEVPRRGILRTIGNALRANLRRSLAIVTAVLLGLVIIGVPLRVLFLGQSIGFALYTSLLTIAGAGDPRRDYSTLEQVVQSVTMIAGVALTPAITAALVDWVVRARLTVAGLALSRPRSGHVVVAGLGDIGSRVIRQLDDLGERVIAVERSEHVPGVDFARRRRIPVIIGDATRADTLLRAHIDHCRAFVPVTSDDARNLEIALNALATRNGLRVVLRLFDGDLAARVQEHFGIMSRSVPYLAAPKFAAALMDRQVTNTIPVGRRQLVIAEIPVNDGADLDGEVIKRVHEPGQCVIIALRGGDNGPWEWNPDGDRRLAPGERIMLLATRTGLGHVLTRSEQRSLLVEPPP